MLRQDNHRRSRLQEARAAKDYNGKRTPGSGNQWFKKGDVISQDYLVECKTTTKASYSLKAEDLSKHWRQTLAENPLLMPVFEVEFSEHGVTCIVLDKHDFMELVNHMKDLQEGERIMDGLKT